MTETDTCSIWCRAGIPRKRGASASRCSTALRRCPVCSVDISKLGRIQGLMESMGSKDGR